MLASRVQSHAAMRQTTMSLLVLMTMLPTAALADRTVSQTVDKRDLSGGERTDEGTRSWTEKNGCESDDAGHIIGNALGGENDSNNMMPLDARLNRGVYAQFEKQVRDLVNKHGEADVFVTLRFNSSVSSTRPTRIEYVAKAPAVKASKLSAATISKTFDNPLPSGWNVDCTCRGVNDSAKKTPCKK